MKKNPLNLYQEHFVENDFERLDLFLRLGEKYEINSVMYPGSFVHVTPSFVFPSTTYVEMDKRAKDFFEYPGLKDFIASHRNYCEDVEVQFFAQDYRVEIRGQDEKYDLLVSQYAGFVSKHCKRYLKIGGVLLANNSHGDAGLASINGNFELIAVVIKNGGKHRLSEKNLNEYFVPKKAIDITSDYLENIQKGIGYIKKASSYIFRRVS